MEVRRETDTLHKLATIGIAKSFGREDRRRWFKYRRDMTPESLRFLAEEFVQALNDTQEDMVSRLPQSVVEGYKKYCNISREMENLSPQQRDNITQKVRLLDSMMTLPVYSWNGERYDMAVLLGPLMDVLAQNSDKFKNMNVIKRGTSLMEIRYGKLVFRDFMNFTSPMSLGKAKKYLLFFRTWSLKTKGYLFETFSSSHF